MYALIDQLESRRLLAVSLLGDSNTITAPSEASGPVTLGATGYMFANDAEHGTELWQTDGTAAGTTLLKDINPGPASSGGDALERAGGLLYFSAQDATGRYDLWKSDGTAAGTVKLTTNATSSSQIGLRNAVDFDGIAILATAQGVFRSDGTAAGTIQIAPLDAGNVVRLGSAVYFIGEQLAGGTAALWKSDGTAVGTTLVRQFATTFTTTISLLNGRLYFWMFDGPTNSGLEPWSSDGTAQGTVPLGDLAPGANSSGPVNFAEFNGAVYFTATTVPNSQRLTLFRTDGSAGSSTVIADIGLNDYSYAQPGIVVFNSAMYFRGANGSDSELWRSDGTPAGTGLFLDLSPGGGSYPAAFQIFNGRLYFEARTPAEGIEMRSTDGTVAGTRLLKEIAPGTRGIDDSYTVAPAIFNGRMYFRADDQLRGTELWSTDGTSDGTTMLKDINTSTNNFDTSTMTPGPGGYFYFNGNDGVHGRALWRTDGTAAGTSIFSDLVLDAPPLYVNGLLMFVASDELWRSDGTTAGTFPLTAAARSNITVFERTMVQVDNRVFFMGFPAEGQDAGLWVSDGTIAGTRLVKPEGPNFRAGEFAGIGYNGKLIFSAHNLTGETGASLLVSDGTTAGTTELKSGFWEALSNAALFNDKVYFTARTSAGVELWSTDGTPAGTVGLDLNPGANSSSPEFLVGMPDGLYFTAMDQGSARQLWRLDQRTPMPRPVTKLIPFVQQVRASARRGIIFTAGNAVYRFDGSNPILLKSGLIAATYLFGSSGRLDYFSARTSADGTELWQTDGTAAGTVMVQDLVPGPGSSIPQNFIATKGGALFSAIVPSVGRELFVLSSVGPSLAIRDAQIERDETSRLIESMELFTY